jgi:hypothetical protein
MRCDHVEGVECAVDNVDLTRRPRFAQMLTVGDALVEK